MERYAAARIAQLEQLLAATADPVKRGVIDELLSSERQGLAEIQAFMGPPDLRLAARTLRALHLGSIQVAPPTIGSESAMSQGV